MVFVEIFTDNGEITKNNSFINCYSEPYTTIWQYKTQSSFGTLRLLPRIDM